MTAKNRRVEIRVTEYEKATWSKAAGGTKLLSDWLRNLANVACVEVDAVGPGMRPAPPRKKTPECERAHFHRPGTWCAVCDKVN